MKDFFSTTRYQVVPGSLPGTVSGTALTTGYFLAMLWQLSYLPGTTVVLPTR